MRSKAQILKTASTLKSFSGKIKKAQDEETLTPEVVKEIAEEIMDVVEVAEELAEEIADKVPAEDSRDALGERREEDPQQIEVAADETEEEKKKRLEKEKTAQDGDDKDKKEDKKEDKDKIENLEAKLASLERKAALAELAPKYATLFPQSMHEAKMNEIINSKDSMPILEAKFKEASNIITNKTMVKIASMNDSIYDMGDSDGEEIDFSGKV